MNTIRRWELVSLLIGGLIHTTMLASRIPPVEAVTSSGPFGRCSDGTRLLRASTNVSRVKPCSLRRTDDSPTQTGNTSKGRRGLMLSLAITRCW